MSPTIRPPLPPKLTALLAVLLLTAALLLCRVHRTARGVWELTVPGLSITALNDTLIGPVLWIYTNNQFRGQWKEGQWLPAEPSPYPTATPYPTSTPYPTPRGSLPQQGA